MISFYFIFIVNLLQWIAISISKFVKLFWSQNLYSKLLSLETSNFISEGVAPRDERTLGDHLPSLFSSETALIPYLLRLVHILVDRVDLQKNCTKGQLVMIFFFFSFAKTSSWYLNICAMSLWRSKRDSILTS